MTTTDTSAVRAWARENGYDVAERGRLPVEVQDAYAAAHGRSAKPAARSAAKPVAKPAAAKKKTTTAARRTAPAPVAAKPAAEPVDPPAAPAAQSTGDGAPQPKPSLVSDDRRLVALGDELAALSERVAALEAAAGTKGNGRSGGKGNGKTPRFRRSR